MFGQKLEYAAYPLFDYTEMEQHLEEMAKKGWMLDKTGIFWQYHQIEPQDIRFAVNYYTDDAAYASKNSEHMTVTKFCDAKKWKKAATYGEIQFLYNADHDPVSIDPDPQTKVDAVRSAVSIYCISNIVTLVAVLLASINILATGITNPTWTFAGGSMLFCLLMLLCIGGVALHDLLFYLIWSKKARESSEYTPTRTFHALELALNIGCMLFVILWLASFHRIGRIVLIWIAVFFIAYFLILNIRAYLKQKQSA